MILHVNDLATLKFNLLHIEYIPLDQRNRLIYVGVYYVHVCAVIVHVGIWSGSMQKIPVLNGCIHVLRLPNKGTVTTLNLSQLCCVHSKPQCTQLDFRPRIL